VVAVHTVVVYDIPDDKYRLRVAEACKDYGLEHIQYSAFEGDLNHNRREELVLRLRKALDQHEGNIQIYVICEKDLGLRKTIDVPPAESKPGKQLSVAQRSQQKSVGVYRKPVPQRAGKDKGNQPGAGSEVESRSGALDLVKEKQARAGKRPAWVRKYGRPRR